MIKNYRKLIIVLLGLYFISPHGFGISFLGLQSLDLPKLIPFILSIIIIFKFNFKKVDTSTFLFLIFIILHFLSIIYSNSFKRSIYEFISHLVLYYPGYLFSYLILKSEKSIKDLLKIINVVVIAYVFFSITEFLFQFNFFDLIRNNYIAEKSRFNNNLGMIRLGFKASMGPFGSTLALAYTFITLFFLKDLYVPKFVKSKIRRVIIDILSVLGIFFTLSRAAIFTVLFLLIFKNLFQNKIKKSVTFLVFISIISLFALQQIKETNFENYLNNYVLNIFEADSNGSQSRVSNNLVDFNFALKRPFTGHGAGMLYYSKTTAGGSVLESSDSSYLISILADRGFISLTIFLILIIITFRRAYFLTKYKNDDFNYNSLIYSFTALFLCINSSQRGELFFLFFLLIGLINKIYILKSKHIC